MKMISPIAEELFLNFYILYSEKIVKQIYKDGKEINRNNGDGTFSESSYQVPVYKNEVQYYTQEEPVYTSVPVYKIKYYYDIDRWTVYDTLLENGSKEDIIRYADVEISNTKRAGEKDVRYLCSMTFTNGKKKGQKCDFTISESIYEALNKDMTVKCRYLGNEILEIK